MRLPCRHALSFLFTREREPRGDDPRGFLFLKVVLALSRSCFWPCIFLPMSQASVYKPLKPYAPKRLVHGFAVPHKIQSGSGERLLCHNCAVDYAKKGAGELIAVTFDGKVKCSTCKEEL